MAPTWSLIASRIKSAWASREVLADRTLRCLPTMWEARVRSLSQKIPWRRKWQPTPVFLPGESHGWTSLVGYSRWGHRVGHDWATSFFFQLLEHIKCFPSIQVVYMLFSQYIPLPLPKRTAACHNQRPPNQTIFYNHSVAFSLNIPF